MPTVDPYGVATMPQPPALPKSPAERANHEAAQLLTHFNAAKMTPDGFVPHVGMPGGADIPKPHGLYTNSLIGPDVWPTESESAIKQASQDYTAFQQRHQQAADTTLTVRDQVFSTSWTSGDAADAAYEHYGSLYRAQLHVVDIAEAGAGAFDRLADDVGRTKRLMREAHDNAHKEIEAYLKAPGGAPTATIAGILATHRGLIQGYSTELRGRGAAETTLLTNKFGIPEAPQVKGAGNGPGNDLPTDQPRDGDPTDLPPKKAVPTGGHTDDLPTSARPDSAGEPVATGGGVIGNALPTPAGVPPKGSGMPSTPSMPSLPSPGGGGGGSSPLSSLGGGMGPLQGLMGGGKGLTGPLNNISPAALQGGPASGATSPASLGSQFGRGMAAGAGAAGAMPPISAPPQAPSAPLAAPISAAGGAPVSGAPAGGATYAPAGNAGGTGTPAVASGGAPAGPMSSYGSVLPPSGMPAPAGGGGGPASIGGAPAAPPVTGGAGTPASGFMPVRDQVAPQQVARHVSMTDLELARAAVADLAAASSVVYPGLEWAVVVSRSASGVPELWVTTNEGAGYIPAGVHIRRSMPLAARFDEDFDARWFGWFNPAETALRAVRARGDAVSAIATTWAQQSELVNDATPDVAIAVAPSSAPGDAEASQLLNSRSHRLETVAPGIYQSLDRAEQHVAEGYARQLTQEAAFSGPELSSVAQSVARGLISARWPSNEEWSALRTEYEMERLMAGSQRPGLQGYEQPEQLVGYVQDFVHCRRLETLLCWEHGTPADVVYAAAMAGVSLNPLVSV